MPGQQIAVPILLPIAVTVLADDPLAEAGYYPADLLYAVVRLPEPAWHGAFRYRDRLAGVLRETPLPDEGVHTDLRHAIATFVDSSPSEHDNPQSGAGRSNRNLGSVAHQAELGTWSLTWPPQCLTHSPHRRTVLQTAPLYALTWET